MLRGGQRDKQLSTNWRNDRKRVSYFEMPICLIFVARAGSANWPIKSLIALVHIKWCISLDSWINYQCGDLNTILTLLDSGSVLIIVVLIDWKKWDEIMLHTNNHNSGRICNWIIVLHVIHSKLPILQITIWSEACVICMSWDKHHTSWFNLGNAWLQYFMFIGFD